MQQLQFQHPIDPTRSMRTLQAELKTALDAHLHEAGQRILGRIDLPLHWAEALAITDVPAPGTEEDFNRLMGEIRSEYESELEEDELEGLTSDGWANGFSTWRLVNVVPHKDKLYAVHEWKSKDVPEFLDIQSIEEGPWNFKIEAYEQDGWQAASTSGTLKVITEVSTDPDEDESGINFEFDSRDAMAIFQTSSTLTRLHQDGSAQNLCNTQEAARYPQFFLQEQALLSLPTKHSLNCIELLDSLRAKHEKRHATVAESRHMQRASADRDSRLSAINAQIHALEQERRELRATAEQDSPHHALAFFGLKEGDCVVHMDAPEKPFEIAVVPGTDFMKRPVITLREFGSEWPQAQGTPEAAMELGKLFLDELRLGEWKASGQNDAPQDSEVLASDSPSA